MKEIILVKLGEIVLKGLNRRSFEDILLKNIRRRIGSFGKFDVTERQSTIAVVPHEGADLDGAEERIAKIFGIATYSRACETQKEIGAICSCTADYLRRELLGVKSFKVECKRSDKKFPLNSPQICAEVGRFLLKQFPNLHVDVIEPEYTVRVEVRDFAAYVHGNARRGAGGIPVGTGGRAAVLISGGIDSPVAAWMMARRGVELTAVHFASPPYTSERAEQKAADLLRRVGEYAGHMTMFTVPFAKIQEEIKEKCPEDLFTIIMRRFMMRASEQIAHREGCEALITGESLGQVASQTLQAIVCTDESARMPVFRPLIIDTYDLSILPYEDCCTVFTPRHPRTRPALKFVEVAEEALDVDALVSDCVERAKITKIEPNR